MLVALTATLSGLRAPDGAVFVSGIAAVVVFVGTTLMAAVKAVGGVVTLVRIARGLSGADARLVEVKLLGNVLMAGFGAWVAYLSTLGFSRGRQLRQLGRVLLPNLRSDRSWTTLASVRDDSSSAPAGVADQWRENGKTEHASVAAFARLTLDLMALGAPPELIAAANRDSLDEIRHAQMCFSLASSLDGAAVSPAPFPQARRAAMLPSRRVLALATLAVDSLVDGALHEGVSARIVARMAERCAIPAIRGMLKQIAADEGRHSAHGWQVVCWCLGEGGAPVAGALLGAIEALPTGMRSQLPAAARSGGWEPWGIHGEVLEGQEYAKARAHVIARVRAIVSRPARAAA